MGTVDMQVVSGFFQMILMALLPILAGAGANWLIKHGKLLAARVDAHQWALALQVVNMVVVAAEQAKLAGLITDKKKYALELGTKYLASRGITLDLAELDAMIEAAVMDEFNRSKELAAPEQTPVG